MTYGIKDFIYEPNVDVEEVEKERQQSLSEYMYSSGKEGAKKDSRHLEMIQEVHDLFGPGTKGMHEFIDRTHCIQTMMGELLELHPSALISAPLFLQVRNVQEHLMKLYTMANAINEQG